MAVQDPVMSLVAFVIGPSIVISVKKLTRRIRAVAHGQ